MIRARSDQMENPPERPVVTLADTAAVTDTATTTARTGWIFDIQRYSLHNGPGIRTTVFLKGCPLDCPWCHNPESRARGPEIQVIGARCIGCDTCGDACPNGLAGIPRDVTGHPTGEPPRAPDPDACLRCGRCSDACPTGARRLVGREVTVDRLLRDVERDRAFHEESGGGVTFSGGEPFAQPAFLLASLAALRDRGTHTAVDTCLVAPAAAVEAAATLANLFLVDLKIMDPERHSAVLGAPVAPVLANLRALDRAGATTWLRVPLVPGYTDDHTNLAAIGAFASTLKGAQRLHLLPYHRFGTGKRDGLGVEDRAGGIEPPGAPAVEEAAAILRGFGLDVRIGG
jgi:pyruvate formate lyase activating enzyme